jgi:uncharacterized protein YcbX
LHQVWIFPVKSMRGMSVPSASITAGGLADDRAWAVVDPTGATVNAKQEPRLRQVAARVVGDGVVALDVPASTPGLTGSAADEALSTWLARRVRLEHRGDAGFVDVAPVHLVSTLSITTSAHAEECDACDISEPRANLVLDLSSPDLVGPDDGERTWIGQSVLLGGATLDVVRRPKHCLGVYANVAVAGRIAVGDAVALG